MTKQERIEELERRVRILETHAAEQALNELEAHTNGKLAAINLYGERKSNLDVMQASDCNHIGQDAWAPETTCVKCEATIVRGWVAKIDGLVKA